MFWDFHRPFRRHWQIHWIQYAASRFKILIMQTDQNRTPYKHAHKKSTVILVILKVKNGWALYIYFGITCQIQILGLGKAKFPKPKLRLQNYLLGLACNHTSGITFASDWTYQLLMRLLLFCKGLCKASALSSLGTWTCVSAQNSQICMPARHLRVLAIANYHNRFWETWLNCVQCHKTWMGENITRMGENITSAIIMHRKCIYLIKIIWL